MSALSELGRDISVCQKCSTLASTRTRVVPGNGPEDAEIMFIGEAPGKNEDLQGLPFVGAAGSFLDELLEAINLNRKQVFVTNIIKCRPPQNRDPLPAEIDHCNPWLEDQIAQLRPRLIVTLGRYSMARFFPGRSIGKVHGTAQKNDGIIYFAMYHPAAALHQQNLRQTIIEDMRRIPPLLVQTGNVPEEQEPRQLTMF